MWLLIFIGTSFQRSLPGWMAASMCRMTFHRLSVTSEGDITEILRGEGWGMR